MDLTSLPDQGQLEGGPAWDDAASIAGRGTLPAAATPPHQYEPARAVFFAVGTIAVLCLAEVITTYGSPTCGMLLYIGVLLAFLALSGFAGDPKERAFFLTLAIAPLTRIVGLGMPVATLPHPFWFLVLSIPLFAAAFVVARDLRLTRDAVSLCWPALRKLPLELAVVASGVGLGVLQWKIHRPVPLVHGHALAAIIGTGLVLLVCTGFLDELLFRGFIQPAAGRFLGPIGGVLFAALVYSVLALSSGSLAEAVFWLDVSLYFGFVVRYTRSLLGVALAHGTINTMVFVVIPLMPSLAATAPRLVIRNTPRTVFGGRSLACDYRNATTGVRQPGCEVVSSISTPGATVQYSLRYADGSTETFTAKADARGQSLHPFNAHYQPPKGRTVAYISVSAVLPDGRKLGPVTTRFAVARR
jgi:membrane protease YdiL (CAAX protease family)